MTLQSHCAQGTHPPSPYPLGLAGDLAVLLVTTAREALFTCCNSPYGD